MNWGLFTIYIFMAIGLGLSMADHGKPKTGNKNIWSDLLNLVIWLTLVWWATGWRFI